MCVILIGHPLDTVKIRLQVSNGSISPQSGTIVYTGTLDCIRKTLRYEGVRGFYKGMTPPLIAVSPMYALCFYGFNLGKSLQEKHLCTKLTYRHIFAAGMLGGLVPVGVQVPIERVKSLLQVQQGSAHALYKGPIDCFRKLY